MMKRIAGGAAAVLWLVSFSAVAQYPAGLPPSAKRTPSAIPLQETPSKPLILVLKNITRSDLFRLAISSLKLSQRVKPLVMRKAHRGYIEYEGLYSGDRSTLPGLIQQSAGDRLQVTSQPLENGGIEIVVSASQGS